MAYYNSHKPEKKIVVGTGEEKKYKTIPTHQTIQKKTGGDFFTKTHKLNKNQPHINADTKLKIIQNVNTITK
jgi:hypothetical protein